MRCTVAWWALIVLLVSGARSAPTIADPNPAHHSSLCRGIFGPQSFDHVGYEGMFLFKSGGRYYLACAENIEGRYSCLVATSKNLTGPFGERYEAIPGGGHNTFFQDAQGQWWSTFFGPRRRHDNRRVDRHRKTKPVLQTPVR